MNEASQRGRQRWSIDMIGILPPSVIGMSFKVGLLIKERNIVDDLFLWVRRQLGMENVETLVLKCLGLMKKI